MVWASSKVSGIGWESRALRKVLLILDCVIQNLQVSIIDVSVCANCAYFGPTICAKAAWQCFWIKVGVYFRFNSLDFLGYGFLWLYGVSYPTIKPLSLFSIAFSGQTFCLPSRWLEPPAEHRVASCDLQIASSTSWLPFQSRLPLFLNLILFSLFLFADTGKLHLYL